MPAPLSGGLRPAAKSLLPGRTVAVVSRTPSTRIGAPSPQPRGGVLRLPQRRRRRQQQHTAPARRPATVPAATNGEEPGWDDWDDEADLVAEASSSTAEALSWGLPAAPWHRQRRQQAEQQQQQEHAEVAAGAADASFAGREGETQQLQASTSGRPADANTAAPTAAAARLLERYQQQQQAAAAASPVAAVATAHVSHAIPPPPPRPSGVEIRYFTLGAIAAVALHYLVQFAGTLPVVRSLVRRFIWWTPQREDEAGGSAADGGSGLGGGPGGAAGDERSSSEALREAGLGVALTTALAVQYSGDEESVEWVNMCWRKAWRVYQRGLERWLADLLQGLFDNLVAEKMVPNFVQRLRIMEFTLDHEAPYFSNMRRRTSRKDSDLNGVVDVRYTGGARMLLLIEVGTGRWRIKIPVMVSDLDLESKLWLKIRLAPMCPWIGMIGLGFVGTPSIKVQLNPYNRIRLMKIPIIQAFLTKLLTVDLPGLITLPKRLEINIPPAVTAVAEAAVGRDAVMRAVASAVLQADALEHALLAALPLGPQGAAGGVSLPDLFTGELQVTLIEARDLPVWGFPWQSNPYCRITLGSQAVQSRRDDDTSHAGRHRAPVWNQDFQFLVEDPSNQTLDLWVRDSPMTGRRDVGRASFPLSQLAADGTADVWLPVESSMPGEQTQGAIHMVITYKQFQDDVPDSGYRAAEAFGALPGQQSSAEITDVKSAADASSRAAVAASAAAAAVAVTKAAAARAAARIARAGTGGGAKPEGTAAAQQQQGDNDGSSNGSSGSSPRQLPSAGSSSSSSNVGTASSVASAVPTNGSQPSGGTANGAASTNGAAASIGSDGQQVEAAGTGSGSNGTDSRSAAVEQLATMAATMQKLTAEVDGIVHSSSSGGTAGASSINGSSSSNGSSGLAGSALTASMDQEIKVAAVEAVAAAEAAAISAVAAGDLAGANQVLQEAALALESTKAQLAVAGRASSSSSSSSTPTAEAEAEELQQQAGQNVAAAAMTPQERAQQALAAAHAAAAEAAQAASVAQAASEAVAAHAAAAPAAAGTAAAAAEAAAAGGLLSADDAAVGLEGLPAAEAAEQRAQGLPSYDSSDEAAPLLAQEKQQPWWLFATRFLPGVPAGDQQAAAGAAAEADGGAGVVPQGPFSPWPRPEGFTGDGDTAAGAPSSSSGGNSSGAGYGYSSGSDGPVADVSLPPDFPLEEIAAEVQKSWKLRDAHVETLVQKALEQRRKQKERPLLQLLTAMSVASAVLLAAVLYRLEHMP